MNDWMSKLERAKALLDAGALTDAEFEVEKVRLMPRDAQHGAEPVVQSEAQIAIGPENSVLYSAPWPKKMLLVCAVIVIIAATGSIFIAWSVLSPSKFGSVERVRKTSGAKSSTTSSISSLSTADTQTKKDQPVASYQCKKGELRIQLPGVKNRGSIVINYPLPDTDGKGELRFIAQPSICVTQIQLAKFAGPATDVETSSDVLVSFDPSGLQRSALQYSVLYCSEIPDTPKPPKNLKIGSFKWRGQRAQPEVSVSWYANFRKHLETDCFCESGTTAPCEAEKGVY